MNTLKTSMICRLPYLIDQLIIVWILCSQNWDAVRTLKNPAAPLPAGGRRGLTLLEKNPLLASAWADLLSVLHMHDLLERTIMKRTNFPHGLTSCLAYLNGSEHIAIEQTHFYQPAVAHKKEFAKYIICWQICHLHLMPTAQKLSASGGGFAPAPGQGLYPWSPLGAPFQTPIIGSRYRSRHVSPSHRSGATKNIRF